MRKHALDYAAFFVLLALIWLILLAFGGSAQGAVPPVIYAECLNRDIQTDLEACGAEPWQLIAIDAITRGGRSKGPVDYIQIAPEISAAQDDEIALGWGHFTAGRRGLAAPSPGVSDSVHYWKMLAFLYSDSAPCVLLSIWERGHRNVITDAAMCSDTFKAAAAAAANSNPTLARQLVGMYACDTRAFLVAYYESHPTDHRRRRVEWLLDTL